MPSNCFVFATSCRTARINTLQHRMDGDVTLDSLLVLKCGADEATLKSYKEDSVAYTNTIDGLQEAEKKSLESADNAYTDAATRQ